jgi:hypothetical protein
VTAESRALPPAWHLPTKNPAARFFTMSSVGFTSQSNNEELEKLREAWRSLNDLLKNLTNAEASLQNHDLSLTANHLQVAKWNVSRVKKAIKGVGQARRQNPEPP